MITDLVIVITAGFCGGVVARLLRQPLVLGYLLAGVIVGPHAGVLTIRDPHNLELLAEIGVTLLLFGLGLELSLKDLAPVRRVAIIGTPIQIGLTVLLGVALSPWLRLTWRSAVWFGALVSLSSTLVVLKTLQAQGRMGTLSSRVMLGMLVAQDLAFIPLMIVLPRIGQADVGVVNVLLVSAKAAAVLSAVVLIGARVIPPVVAHVARSGSRELFLLVTTALALGIGYLTHWFGLSSAVGAFAAGLMLSESEYSHQALSDIIPLRDVFSLLFFASVGMLLDPADALSHWRTVAMTVAVVSVGKGAIFWGVTRAFGYANVVPLASALALFQVGEFSFVLARAGLAAGAVSRELYSLVLNTAVVTMMLMPVVSGLTPGIYAWMLRRRAREPVQTINVSETALAGHIVIAGAGRVGSSVAEVLRELRLPFVLIELDHRRLDHAREQGWPIVFGDATRPAVLEAAAIAGARLLLVTTPAVGISRGVIENARGLNPTIPVVARAEHAEAAATLQQMGVWEVVQPELEASLEMTRQALLRLRIPALEIVRLTDRLRETQHEAVAAGGRRQDELVARLGAVCRQLDLRWLRIGETSPWAGRTIGEVGVRAVTGASIVAVMGTSGLVRSPGPDCRLSAGDLVAVVADPAELEQFERAAGSENSGERTVAPM